MFQLALSYRRMALPHVCAFLSVKMRLTMFMYNAKSMEQVCLLAVLCSNLKVVYLLYEHSAYIETVLFHVCTLFDM